MNKTVSTLALTALLGSAALAQTSNRNATANSQGGVFPLPDKVERAVALDHTNQLLAQTRDDAGGTITQALSVKHVYIGGIAQLFGIPVIPSRAFVSPGFNNGGFNNGLNQPGFNNGGANNGINNGGFNNGGNVNGGNGGNGFLFPQNNITFGAGQPNFSVQPFGQFGPQFSSQPNANTFNGNNLGNVPQGQPVRPRGQAGLGIGTPRGNFFLPSQITN